MGRNNQRRPEASGDSPWFPPPTAQQPTMEQLVAAEVVDAVVALRSRDHHGAERALGGVVRLAGTAEGRRLVVREVVALLDECVDTLWHHGWSPREAHRVVGRELDVRAQDIMGDAMVHQLAGYARSTVADRWFDELSSVGATLWWPADLDPVTARSVIRDEGVEAVLTSALRVSGLLLSLPPLEPLDPLPGTVRRGSGGASSSAAAVDARILERVRALLAKAESTPYEAEAETFTAGAQALMARHSIDLVMLASRQRRPDDSPQARRIGIDRPYESPKVSLLDAVASANRCRTVWTKGLGLATVVGFDADLAWVETIFTSLLVQATRAMTSQGPRVSRPGQSRTRAFRQSFLTAYAWRIGARLGEETEEQTQAAVDAQGGAEAVESAGRLGGELVRVLAERATEVDDTVSAMFPHLVHRPLGGATDPEGWSAGADAADRATLASSEHRLPGSRSG